MFLFSFNSLQSLSEIDEFDETRTLSDYIDGILKKQRYYSDLTSDALVERFDKYEKYLLGATALDCSMMIAFQKISENDSR